MDGRAALRARSIVSLLPRMAEVWLRDPRRLRADPRFAQQILGSEVCVRDPRIIAQKLGSEVCAAKSSDGLNLYFAHNISTILYPLNMECTVHCIHSIWSRVKNKLRKLVGQYVQPIQYMVGHS